MKAVNSAQHRLYPAKALAGMRVLKYQALGNSYIIVDPSEVASGDRFSVTRLSKSGNEKEVVLSPWFVKGLGHKNWGIGSNGILFGPFVASNGEIELQIYNTDGTRAAKSGNGLRIFSKFLYDAGYLSFSKTSAFSLTVVVPAEKALHREEVAVQVIDPALPLFALDIGEPKFGPAKVKAVTYTVISGHRPDIRVTVGPIDEAGRSLGADWSDSTFVSVGNPHCVTFVRDSACLPSTKTLDETSRLLSAIAYAPPVGDGSTFSDGCNLQWAYVKDRSTIELRIFERGEGVTEASGSSAAAAAAAAFYRGLTENLVTVRMPGGDLAVELRGTRESIESVFIRGSAARVMEAEIDLVDFCQAVQARFA